ncbi:hypothetical protein RND71_011642 [Anisodus tanguticus]|uniref:F-box domain-containing protein n=1 Tax=Anisodus tanguticus TaxID=243964 RepID=A0AAE1SDP5_9SOLA|nr:hypothetical protein RND71_011642 [Anisodus tanguticus]
MGEQHQSPGGSYGDDGNSEGLSEECADTSGIDWISKLPDALIIQILSLIPLTEQLFSLNVGNTSGLVSTTLFMSTGTTILQIHSLTM